MIYQEEAKKSKPIKIRPSISLTGLHRKVSADLPVSQAQPVKCYVNELVEIADEMDGSLLLDQSGYQSGANALDTRATENFQTPGMDGCFNGWSGKNQKLANTLPSRMFESNIPYQRSRNLGSSAGSFFNTKGILKLDLKKEAQVSSPELLETKGDCGANKYFSDSKFQEFYVDQAGIYSKTNFFQEANPHLKKSYPTKLASWFSGSTKPSHGNAYPNSESVCKDRLQSAVYGAKGILSSGKTSQSDLNQYWQTKYSVLPYQADPAESVSIRRALGSSHSQDSAEFHANGLGDEDGRQKSIFDKARRPNTLGYIPSSRGYIPFTNFRKHAVKKEEVLARSPSFSGDSGRNVPEHRLMSAVAPKQTQNPIPNIAEDLPLPGKQSSVFRRIENFGSNHESGVRRIATSQAQARSFGGFLTRQSTGSQNRHDQEAKGELRLNNTYLVRSAARTKQAYSSPNLKVHKRSSHSQTGLAGPEPLPQKPQKPINLSLAGVRLQEPPVPFSVRIGRPSATARSQLSRSHSAGWLKPSPHRAL